MDVSQYIPLFSMDTREIMEYFHLFLRRYYPRNKIVYYKEPVKSDKFFSFYKNLKIQNIKDFLFAEGEIPILITAHADTISSIPPTKVLRIKDMLTSVDIPLGADDRAGMIVIMELIKAGFRPYIVLTGGEERGYIGAAKFLEQIDNIDVHLILGIDAPGEMLALACSHEGRENLGCLLEKYGFKISLGSTSDVCYIGEGLKNTKDKLSLNKGFIISAGYYEWHRNTEYLNIKYLSKTIKALKKLLKDVENGVFDPNECIRKKKA